MTAVDVRDLLDSPGSSRQLHLAERFEDLETELGEASPEVPLRIDVLLESVLEGILVSGPLSGRIDYRCARCLTPFSGDFRVEVTELFAREPTADDDDYPVREGAIDLEPMVRDAVLLAMPFSPLCREDCQGLCERCGGDRNVGECTCPPPADPRWEPLSRWGWTRA
ncbi:MAG TPA: YceD family protein [Actinomycetota bacterium]|nr:YceD family protein [Actinomycetota bacterium]